MKWSEHISTHTWQPDEIFVFGSNLDGAHGAGAALFARQYCGAVLGQGVGLQGQSYAIPTCRHAGVPLKHMEVVEYVLEFLDFVDHSLDKKFFLTAVGTGIAGFTHEDMAQMFDLTPLNVRIPPEWEQYLQVSGRYYRFSSHWKVTP